MSCQLCEKRGGLSGYARMTADGGRVDLPCRCITDERDRELYGHPSNRLAMLRALSQIAVGNDANNNNQKPTRSTQQP